MLKKFHLPIPIARLHPNLSGEDLTFIRAAKDEGMTNLEAFKSLLASKGIEISSELNELYS